jgi:drug/metabolite transporter (DMT)-like permease
MAGATARGVITAFGAATIYGAVPVAARVSYDFGMKALEVVTCRTIVIILVLGFAALATRQSFRIPASARLGFLLQVLATVIVSASLLASVQFIPVSVAMLVFYTFPILIALVSPVIEGAQLTLWKLALVLLAFIGLAVALGPQFEGLDVRGLALAACSSVGCALQFVAGRMVAGKMASMPLAVLVHIGVLPVAVGLLFVTESYSAPVSPAQLWMAALAVLATGLLYCAAYFLHMSSVTHAPASVVAPYFNVEPVVSTLLAAALLGEQLSLQHVAGGFMVLVAVILTSLPERTRTAHG